MSKGQLLIKASVFVIISKRFALNFLLLFPIAIQLSCSINGQITSLDSASPESKLIQIDTTITPPAISASNQNAFPVGGQCPEGSTEIQVGDPLITTMNCSNGHFSGTLDLSSWTEGNHEIVLIPDVGDRYTGTILKDTTAPVATVLAANTYINISNVSSYGISGACSENSQFVYFQVGLIEVPTVCSAGHFSSNLDFSSVIDGSVIINIRHVDSVGNTSTSSIARTKDTVAPGTPVLTNAPANPSPQISLDITVSGTDVVSYEYKFGSATSVTCSESGGYGSSQPVATHISDNISAQADGPMRLCVRGVDIAGNNSSLTQYDWVKDSTIALATVSGYTPAGSPSNSGVNRAVTIGGLNITHYKAVVTFNQSCSTADFSSAVETAVTTDFNFSIGSDGDYRVCVIGKNVANYWQPDNAATSSSVLTIDRVQPSLTLTSATSDPFNAATFSVTATFSESVTGFELSDINITNGIASSLSGSGTTYTFTVTPSAQGLVTVAVGTGVAQDSAGNTNTAATNLTRAYDSVQPSLSLSSAANDPFNSATISVTATFSESVTGFALSDISVTNGVASSLSGSGTTYTFTVTPSGQGLVTVAVGAGVAQDPTGNINTAATNITRTYDSIVPTITGLSNDGTWRTSKTWNWGCDETCTYRFIVDTSAVTTPSGSYDSTTSTSQSSGSGTYYLHVQAQDTAGNNSITHVSALLDSTNPNPAASVTDGTTLSSLTQSPTINFTSGTDAHSGVQKHQLRVLRVSDSLVMKDWHDFTSGNSVAGLSLVTDTAYKVEVKVIDNLNLESPSAASDGWIADTSAPGVPTGLSLGSVPYVLTTSPPLYWSAASDGTGSGISYYQARVYRTSDNATMSAWTTLSSGGSISGLSLTSGVQYYFKVRASDNAGNIGTESSASGSWTAISAFVFSPIISSNVNNYDLRSAAIAAGWNQTIPLIATVTISGGVTVGSTSTGAAAFTTGTTFPSGSSLTLINNGLIQGAGGAGGMGGYGYTCGYGDMVGYNGAAGGPALYATAAFTVQNNGYIYGGGGGGGGGGVGDGDGGNTAGPGGGGGGGGGGSGSTPGAGALGGCCPWGNWGWHNGSNGSAGAGGNGGGASTYPSAIGGAGGGPGQAGSPGSATTWRAGGAGGAAGSAVVGNAYITWTATGTRLGPIN